ncbi:hypothetical protein ACHHYP_09682 [Achlya hypogyna]|uniref:DUF3752 domain-containing protein n=1 Tax=Achlya hypogyna TaxID=1202772 RepID=A0A1V9YMN0_ACHHY|nr:hypothetical protein ACHHYP_09682 [Achlya hypogyna]
MGSGKDKVDRKHDKKRKHKKEGREDDDKGKRYKTSSDDALARMNLDEAATFIKTLCTEHTSLAGDLLQILKMVDAGEAVVIGGIENKDIRKKLEVLFPLMGLAESGPGGAYSKHKVAKRIALYDRMKPVVKPPTAPTPTVKSTPPARRIGPIGPQRPPSTALAIPVATEDYDDGPCVGPVLPGMAGFREASAEVEAEMARRAAALEKEQWDRVRGVPAPTTTKPLAREEWMLSLPKDASIQDALGGLGDLTARKFRSRAKDERDDSWFASPEERQRALREQSQMDLLGYVPGGATAKAKAKPQEEVFVAPRPREGKSLLEAHQEKLAVPTAGGSEPAPATWDRERDMNTRRNLSRDSAQELIRQASEMSSRFAAPKVTRQFL